MFLCGVQTPYVASDVDVVLLRSETTCPSSPDASSYTQALATDSVTATADLLAAKALRLSRSWTETADGDGAFSFTLREALKPWLAEAGEVVACWVPRVAKELQSHCTSASPCAVRAAVFKWVGKFLLLSN